MKHIELTKDACELLAQCIKREIEHTDKANEIYREAQDAGVWVNGSAEIYLANNERIGKLQTLLNYIEAL